MSAFEIRHRLKKPLVIYALAACFIIAPFGNAIASMIGFGVSNWYSPAAFFRYLDQISWLDRSWMALTVAAGLALLRQRRSTWIFALGALILTSAINVHYGLKYNNHLSKGAYFFPILFMLSNLSVLAVLYHFRFPYLDRREAWWGVSPRYRCNFPVTANGLSGKATNISKTGAFVELTQGTLEMNAHLEMTLGPIHGLQAEVLHVSINASGNGYGIEFAASSNQTAAIKKLIRDLVDEPIVDSPATQKITA